MDQDDLGFELVASSLRADTRDLTTFVDVLATKLEGLLPSQTEVERKGAGIFSKEKHVHRIRVALGDGRYELVAKGGRLEPTFARAVRGIVLKTEQLSLDDWIEALSRDIAAEAQNSEQARLALERLLS